MVTHRSRPALALSLCLALAAPALHAQARPDGAPAPSRQELEEAVKRYKRGLELFHEGSYEASMLEFRKANELAPSYKILFNIAQVSRQLNDYARAVEFYERYLREGGSNVPPARAAEVQRELEKIRPRTSKVEIVSNVAGATVTVDDLNVGRTPFAQPLLVNAGRHKFVAAAEGRPPVTSAIEVAGAESVRVSLDFPDPPDPNRAAGPGAAQPTAAEAGPRGDAARVALSTSDASAGGNIPWVAWGVTGGLAVGAGVTGVLALRAKSRYQDERDSLGAQPSDIDDRYGQARTLGIVTDVLIGATAVAAGVSLYLTVSGGKKSGEESAQAPAPSWGVGLGPGYVGARGTF
ncbi:MAG TPA: PEGA domain-containing protein [Polyangiaceae bacterium]|nr:PEGA domain-containing protein [Polyangiaceae bacterium]